MNRSEVEYPLEGTVHFFHSDFWKGSCKVQTVGLRVQERDGSSERI